MDEERLDWIERWYTGWKQQLEKEAAAEQEAGMTGINYGHLPMECAVDMGLELVAAMKDAD